MLFLQVFRSDEDATCKECLELGSKHRFLARICNFVWTLDMAKLLHIRMFHPEEEEDFVEKLRASANYCRRLKTLYDTHLELELDQLHHKVKCIWNKRVNRAGAVTEALELFVAVYVRPSLDAEPGQSIKHAHLEKLLAFMGRDPTTSSADLNLVRAIVTGEVSRHPAVQGVLVACITKVRALKSGATTMRNRHRVLFA